MKLVFNWLIYTAAILITAYILPGVTIAGDAGGLVTALVLAVVLGAINTFIKPVLILLTFPITILSLGLFILVINAILVMAAAAVVPGFAVSGFWSALVFAVVLALIHGFLHFMSRPVKKT